MYKLTYLEAVYSTILWLIMYFKYKPAMQMQKQSNGNYFFFLIAIIFFSVFGFISGGDFFSYYELYVEGDMSSLESFYQYLFDVLPHGYYYWRFVIWGLSSVLVVLTYRRLQAPPLLSCLLFILILLFYFPAPRNTLGYVVLYYSVTYIVKPTKYKLLSYIVGFLGIFLSCTLHKSMPLYVGIMLFSFLPMKKWIYIASLCIFPILYGEFYQISAYVLGFGNEMFQDRGSYYLESENFAVSNAFGYVQLLFERFPLILLLSYSIFQILSNKIHNKFVIIFIQYSYWLVYISFLFYKQATSSFLSPRFWDASLYPLAFALPFVLYQKKELIIKWSFYLLVIANILYKILYPIYKI